MRKKILFVFCCTISFFALAQPANDNPAGAVSLSLTSKYYASAVSGTTIAATNSGISGSSTVADDDVWYKFEITPTNTRNVSIALRNIVFAPTSPSNNVFIRLWNSTLSTGVVANFTGVNNHYSLGNGTWYIQVYTDDVGSQRVNFDISVKELPNPSLPNDDCGGAIALTSQANSCSTPINANNIGATTSTPALSIPAANNDVWYKFTAMATKHFINLTNVNFAPGAGYPTDLGISSNDVNIEFGSGNCVTYAALGNSGNALTYETPTLVIGTEYFIRVSTILTITQPRFIDFDICVTHYPAPANDNVSGAISIIPASGNCFTPAGSFTGSTLGATPSPQTLCSIGSDTRDVWFNFTATANFVRLGLETTGGFQPPIIELWNTDATNRIACVNDKNLSNAVTNGSNYKVRVAGYNGSYLNSFTLSVLCGVPPPNNDECFNSTTIPLNTSLASPAITSQTTAGASSISFFTLPNTCTGSYTGGDVWYSFRATKNEATIVLKNKVTTGSNAMMMQLYPSGCTSNSPLTSVCGDSLTFATIPSTFYNLRIMKQSGCETVTFDIHTAIPPPPVNDECLSAINLPLNIVNSCTVNIQKISSTTFNSSQSVDDLGSGTCSADNDDDVWFSFTSNAGSNKTLLLVSDKVPSNAMSPGNLKYVLYAGNSCGTKTFVSCGDISSFGDITEITTTASTKYYLRIYGSNFGTQYNFKIAVLSIAASANQTCALATTLTATNNTTAAFTFGTTLGTPADEGDCIGGTTGSRGVWYKFVATATSHLLDIGCVFSLEDGTAMANAKVFSGSCGSFTELFCFSGINNSGGVITGLTIGQTNHVLLTDMSFNSTPIAFSVRISGGEASNNEPAGAITLTQNPTCTEFVGSNNFSTNSTSPVLAAHPSGFTYAGDVWFKFIANSNLVNIQLTNNPLSMIKVYNNALSAELPFLNPLTTGAIGVDGGNLQLDGLTIGQNYYIRVAIVYNQLVNPAPSNGINKNFNLCVYGLNSFAIANNVGAIGACRTANGGATSTNSNTWLHLTDDGNIVASVFDNPGGAGMGALTTQYQINAGEVRTTTGGIKYMDRNYTIIPTTQPINPVKVRLYFTKTEIDNLITASAGTSSPATSISDLRIHKLSGIPCNTVIAAFSGGFYTILNFGELNNLVWFIDVEVPSFSSFFVGPPGISVLPIKLQKFTANFHQNKVALNWQISSAQGIEFIIQKSEDGKNFVSIGNEIGKQTTEYNFIDNNGIGIKQYYRLKLIQKDGSISYSNIAIVQTNTKINDIIVFPNPIKNNQFQIQLNSIKQQKVNWQLWNSIGQQADGGILQIAQGNQTQSVQLKNNVNGLYMLKVLINDSWISKTISIVN